MTVQLYTALVPLKVASFAASWPCPVGGVLPLDDTKPSTLALVADGEITLAPPGSMDTVTPRRIVRGIPGLHIAVSN